MLGLLAIGDDSGGSNRLKEVAIEYLQTRVVFGDKDEGFEWSHVFLSYD